MRSLSQALVLVAGAAASTAPASTPAIDGLEKGYPIDACDSLSKLLPGRVHAPNSTEYISENLYWSNRQAEVHPRCFVTPENTSDVSIIVKTLTSLKEPFTVKSGGHTAFEGGSNIADGVTIDLVHLNQIVVSKDKKTVSVGPGNRWIDVSRKLDPLGLAVVAGRVADVGVGGLILGGGISYFSGKYGWACDNVRTFEVVTASGNVVEASPTRNPDLFWALRGGSGSNFGIVTNFDLVSFPQGDLWANTIIFPGSANTTLIPLFTELSQKGLVQDHDAHTYLVMTYVEMFGGFINLASFFHATPPPKDTVPAVFKPFQSVPGALVNTTQSANITTQSIVIDEPYGARQTWWDTSVAMSSPELLEGIVKLFEVYVQKVLKQAAGSPFTPFLVFHPIPENVLQSMQNNGGNALGLKPEQGPLMIVQLSANWEDKSLDNFIEQAIQELIQEIEKTAKNKGLYRGYVYINYAGKDQEVFQRYGHESYARLKATAEKWDPKGDLHKFWRGYFKI